MLPDRHEQLSPLARIGASKLDEAGMPEHTFFDPLIEPSLQTKFVPAQCATPPLLPEHG